MPDAHLDTAHLGIWCPWGEVLCHECHGPTKWPGNHGNHSSHSQEPMQGFDPDAVVQAIPQDICHCENCGKAVALQRDVATLLRLKQKWDKEEGKPKLTLEQTGGMNVALSGKAGEYFTLITEDEEHPGKFLIGIYDDEDWEIQQDWESGFGEAELLEYMEEWA